MSGIVGIEQDLADLHVNWMDVLSDPKWPSKLTEFHTFDCVRDEGEIRKGGWGFAERLALYGEFARLLVKYPVKPIGASVLSGCFNDISEDDLRLLSEEGTQLGTPLDVCFHMIVQQLIDSTSGEDSVAVIFDRTNTDRQAKLSGLCDLYMSTFHLGDRFAGYGFTDSRKLAALQAADLVAYGTYRLTQERYWPDEPEPYFPVVPAFWNMLLTAAKAESTAPYGKVFDANSLRDVIGKVKRRETLPRKGDQ